MVPNESMEPSDDGQERRKADVLDASTDSQLGIGPVAVLKTLAADKCHYQRTLKLKPEAESPTPVSTKTRLIASSGHHHKSFFMLDSDLPDEALNGPNSSVPFH